MADLLLGAKSNAMFSYLVVPVCDWFVHRRHATPIEPDCEAICRDNRKHLGSDHLVSEVSFSFAQNRIQDGNLISHYGTVKRCQSPGRAGGFSKDNKLIGAAI